MRALGAVINGRTHTAPLRLGFFAVVTAAAWTAFGWLIFPAVTAVLWLVGVSVVYDETLANLQTIDGRLLSGVLVAAVLVAGLLVGWAEVQRRRFSGVERRQRALDIAVSEVGALLGATPEIIARLQAGRVMVLEMRDDGTPRAVLDRPVDDAPAVSTLPLIPSQCDRDAVAELQPDPQA